MNNNFISVIIVLKLENLKNIHLYLKNVHSVLKSNFSHYEIIIVNNCVSMDIELLTRKIPSDIKKDIGVINLTRKIEKDNAIVAGFDRANGDYTIVLDFNFDDNPRYIMDLFEKSKENHDIVCLKHKKRYIPKRKIIFYKLFYFIINKFSGFKINMYQHESRIISRRALNGILSYRENIRYMKGIYSIVGYPIKSIKVDIKTNESESFRDYVKSFFYAITSFSGILNKLFFGIFLSSLIFVFFVIINALFVKFFGYNLLGYYIEDLPVGWTFIILLVSIIFTLTSFMLYLITIYLDIINKEVKGRPIYIIESFQRL
jgi:hypothetical protein